MNRWEIIASEELVPRPTYWRSAYRVSSTDSNTGSRAELGTVVGSSADAIRNVIDHLEIGDCIVIPGDTGGTGFYWILGITDERGRTRVVGRSAGGGQN